MAIGCGVGGFYLGLFAISEAIPCDDSKYVECTCKCNVSNYTIKATVKESMKYDSKNCAAINLNIKKESAQILIA